MALQLLAMLKSLQFKAQFQVHKEIHTYLQFRHVLLFTVSQQSLTQETHLFTNGTSAHTSFFTPTVYSQSVWVALPYESQSRSMQSWSILGK